MTATPRIAGSRSSLRTWMAMIPMLLGILIGSLTINAATTALPAIRRDLGLSPAEGVWIIDIYPLVLAATLVAAARAGDQFGRKRMMIAGLTGFAIINLLGGMTSSGLLLIVARGLLGVAEALILANVVATIGSHFQASERVLAYGMWTAVFGTGAALGPVAGGLLSEGPGWRWIMYGCVPLAAIAVGLAGWLVPESRTATPPTWDLLSLGSSVIALAGVVYGLQHAASDPLPAAIAGVLGVLSGAIFVRRQLRAEDPLIDVRIFAIRPFTVAYSRILITTGASAATIYLTSLHLQDTRGDSPTSAGLVLLPQAITIAVGGVLAPALLRWASGRMITLAALVLQSIGLVWITFDPASFVVPLVLAGLGMGAVGTLTAAELFETTNVEQAGQVGAIQEVGFALGNGLGVAILGTVALAFAANGFTVAIAVAAAAVLASALLPELGRRRRSARPADHPARRS